MNNLFITYHLNSADDKNESVDKAIEQLGNSTKLHPGSWYVNSQHSADKAVKHIRQFLSEDDTLIIADTSNDESTWFNLEDSRAQRVRQNWEM